MNTTELKVGQLWYVDDDSEEGFACPYRSSEGDIIEINRKDLESDRVWYGYNHASNQDNIVVYSHDALANLKYIGTVETHGHLIGGSTEASEDDSPVWASSVPEGVETHAQVTTEAPESIQSGLSAELLWKFIEGTSEYNGHKHLEVGDLPWDVLKDAVKTLGEYLEYQGGTLATSLEIRLMYNGDSGKFAETWGAGVYQLDYWKVGEHKNGHRDRLLFGVDIVKGI